MTNGLSCQFDRDSTFRKISLPPRSRWGVTSEDCVISGTLLSLIKRKASFFNHSSTILARAITLTRHGLLIIYKSDDLGYVVNLPDALKVKTSTRGADGMKRTCIKIKMIHGSVSMAILGEVANNWIRNILIFASGKEMAPLLTPKVGIRTAEVLKKQPLTELEEEEEEEKSDEYSENESLHDEGQLASPLRELEVMIPQSSDTTTTTADPFSIRQGDLSVATLRHILEAKMDTNLTSFRPVMMSAIKKTSCVDNEEPKPVIKEETKPVIKVKRHFFCKIMGKSRSAPAVLESKRH